jgi:hypothetical protein
MSRAEKCAAALREFAEFKITPGDLSTTAGEDPAEMAAFAPTPLTHVSLA